MRNPSVTKPSLRSPSSVSCVTPSTTGTSAGIKLQNAKTAKTATTAALRKTGRQIGLPGDSLAIADAGVAVESDNASSAKARSEADWKRCSGDFSRQRWAVRCTAGGMFATSAESGGGSSFRIALIVSTEVVL